MCWVWAVTLALWAGSNISGERGGCVQHRSSTFRGMSLILNSGTWASETYCCCAPLSLPQPILLQASVGFPRTGRCRVRIFESRVAGGWRKQKKRYSRFERVTNKSVAMEFSYNQIGQKRRRVWEWKKKSSLGGNSPFTNVKLWALFAMGKTVLRKQISKLANNCKIL